MASGGAAGRWDGWECYDQQDTSQALVLASVPSGTPGTSVLDCAAGARSISVARVGPAGWPLSPRPPREPAGAARTAR
jgi:hypothetical protein